MSVNGLSGEDIPVLCVLYDADLFSKGGKRMSGIKGNFDARALMTESFTRGWMKIHNPVSTLQVTDALTPYEGS